MQRLEINGHYENVSEDVTDFSYLVEKYMGSEAKHYFDSAIEKLFDTIHNLEIENDELNEQLGQLEEYNLDFLASEIKD